MKTYYVTVKVETTIEVEATSEEQAQDKATSQFDPYALDWEVVETWTDEETT